MINSLKSSLSKNLTNIRGWKTNRKIIVIESDDWGSIRTPFIKPTILSDSDISSNPYFLYDTLASRIDLESVFEVQLKYKDIHGNHPIITANTVVANPDFDNIKKNNFETYYYEPFVKTLKRYYPNQDVWSTWKEGLKSKLFFPQFHGREHLNVPLWLQLLRENNIELLKSFDLGCWWTSSYNKPQSNLQASYDSAHKSNLNFHSIAIKEGLQVFENIFGYASQSFIANNYIWSPALDKVTSKGGVKYIQGMKFQKLPSFSSSGKRKMIRHYLGDKNMHGQYYLIRNCVFEPSLHPINYDNVGECLKYIQNAFLWRKPAIITTHRLNFVGALDYRNRDRNLTQFEALLKEITKRWPNVEFMTSVELGRVMELSNIQ